jgi:hypothetical protein
VNTIALPGYGFPEEMNNGSIDVHGELQIVDSISYLFYVNDVLSGRTNALVTTALVRDRIGFLMKRHTKMFDVNFIGLLAGIRIDAFCLLLVSIILIAILTYVNEVLQRYEHKNNMWEILTSLMPCSTSPMKYQYGLTRKVVMLTGAFTILLSTTYYQCNLLEQLILPRPIPSITLADIVDSIRSYRSKLHLDIAVTLELPDSMNELKAALKHNPPVIDSEKVHIMQDISNDNAILIEAISMINYRLSQLPPAECEHYVVVEVPEISPSWLAFGVHTRRKDLVEPMSVIVSERRDFVTNLIDKYQMSDECRNHIHPPIKQEPRYVPLNVYTLSGSFALLGCLCMCAVCVLFAEMLIKRFFIIENITVDRCFMNNMDELFKELLHTRVTDVIYCKHIQLQYNILRDMCIEYRI